MFAVELAGGRRIELERGDLTRERTDAIVNAANSSLLGGGGVDGAIHRAGGPAILEACRKIRAARGRLPAGQAVATTGGKLHARWVIHTVGPVWQDGSQGEARTLADCHHASIAVGEELRIKSLAFPAISTGNFGYPVRAAAKVALLAVREALPHTKTLKLVRFVLFDDETLRVFEEEAKP
jgi:O-acetyl-ADP-ribose deacetylase (regulator of RNase III)